MVKGPARRHGVPDVRALAATAVVGCLAAFAFWHGIGVESLWFDEAFSYQVASSSNRDFIATILNSETYSALYYVLLRAWLVLGDGEAVMRSLSALFGVAASVAVYATGARLYDRVAGFIAGVLLSVNVFFIQYAQELRAYTLAAFLVTLSMYLFLRALDRPSVTAWLVYVAAAVLAVHAHFFAGFVVVGQLGLALFAPQIPRRHVLAVTVLMTVAVAPLAFLELTSGVNRWWIPPISIDLVLEALQQLAGSSYRGAGVAGAAAALVFACVASLTVVRDVRTGHWWRGALVLSWLLVPIVSSAVLSLIQPMFVTRYLIVVMPAYVVLVGAGISRLRPRAAAFGVSILLIALSARGAEVWYREYDKPNWRAAVAMVTAELLPGDLVAVVPEMHRRPYAYYARESPATVVPLTLPPDPAAAARAANAIAEVHPRIWLIEKMPSSFGASMEQEGLAYDVVRQHSYVGVDVVLYERRQAAPVGPARLRP